MTARAEPHIALLTDEDLPAVFEIVVQLRPTSPETSSSRGSGDQRALRDAIRRLEREDSETAVDQSDPEG